jgi:hypothetical protein
MLQQPLLSLLNPSYLVAASSPWPHITCSLLEVHDRAMGEHGAIVGPPEGVATLWRSLDDRRDTGVTAGIRRPH